MKKNKKKIYMFIFCLIFLVLFYMVPLTGDDWGKSTDIISTISNTVNTLLSYNGRVFGNNLVVILKSSIVFRIIIQTILMAILLKSFYDNFKTKNESAFILSLMLIIIVPIGIYREVYFWMSGYANFFIPSLAVVAYLSLISDLFSKKPNVDYSKNKIIIGFFLGLLTQLFAEHTSIYGVALGIVVIIISKKMITTIPKLYILYLLGALIGFVIMFSSPVYWTSMPRLENINFFNNLTVIGKIKYNIVTWHWFKYLILENIILNLLIFVILIVESVKNKDIISKYSLILTGLIIYPLYILLSQKFSFLAYAKYEIIISAMMGSVILISLYRFYYKKNKLIFIKLLLLLVGAIFSVSPLLLSYGIGPRTFFISYVMFAAFAINLFETIIIESKYERYFNNINKTFIICIGVVILYMVTNNHFVHAKRIEMINLQLKDDLNVIEIQRYPFEEVIHQTGSPMAGYHLDVFKRYFNIPNNKQVEYID